MREKQEGGGGQRGVILGYRRGLDQGDWIVFLQLRTLYSQPSSTSTECLFCQNTLERTNIMTGIQQRRHGQTNRQKDVKRLTN